MLVGGPSVIAIINCATGSAIQLQYVLHPRLFPAHIVLITLCKIKFCLCFFIPSCILSVTFEFIITLIQVEIFKISKCP